MIVITGWRTTIAQEFRKMLPDWEATIRAGTDSIPFPTHAERYLFCQGVLIGKSIAEQTNEEIEEGLYVNCTHIMNVCDEILDRRRDARICIIGSESGFRGSYNENYAEAKRAIHHYVTSKRLKHPHQQLVAISPSIIEDSGMTRSRDDKSALKARKALHPMKRFLRAQEVARMAHELLYQQSYISGTIIRMHGGLGE